VQKGENLHKIAEQVKPSTVTTEQMLVALYRENKSAFIGNMNLLKTGQILKVPSADEVAAIDTKEANKEVRVQVADWKGYRENVASGVASLPAKPESSNVSSGRVASAAVSAPAPAPVESKDVLKLSKADVGKGGSAAGQARVNALQEEVTAKDKALKESQSRVADLEKQIKDMQRLLDIQKTQIAAASKAAPAPAPAPAPAKVEPVKAPEPMKAAEPAKTEPPKVAEAPKVEPPKAEPPKTEAPKEEPKATPPKKAAPPPPPPPKEWYEDLMDPMYLALGGGGILAVGIGAFLFMRRRKARAEAGPSSAMTSAFPSDLKPGSTTGKAGGGLVDTGNSSFLTDFDKTGPGTIDTDEVDPVAEAEVYIAYGRDAQAEEILKEAMARDKNRHEIALKLLEIYHARKSATAFETVAKELHASVGESSPLWQKAAAMGAQIDPTNSLYAAGAGAAGAASLAASAPAPARPNLDFDVLGKGGGEEGGGGGAAAPDFDLDLDGKSGGGHEAPAEPAASGLDFDIAPSGGEAPVMHEAAAEPAKEEKPSFDFDLSGLEFPGTKAAAPAHAAPAADSGGLNLADLNLDPAPAGGGEGGEAVGTKLELAKAYLEIGDKDGAREILNEVAREGTSDQKEEANRLIAGL
jgi:pilus assembly protein FimV